MTTYNSSTAKPTSGTHVFVDGPSLDHALGRVIGEPPSPQTRPDWRQLDLFAKRRELESRPPLRKAFAIWSPGQTPFMNFLEASRFEVLLGELHSPGRRCSDIIRSRIEELNSNATSEGSWTLIVGTHDESLMADLTTLAPTANSIILFGFDDLIYEDIDLDEQVRFFDIEHDAHLFRQPLVRIEQPDEDVAAFGDDDDWGAEELSDSPSVASSQTERSPRPPADHSNESPPSFSNPDVEPPRDLYLLVDSRSTATELGDILGMKPDASTRPNWGAVLEFARKRILAPGGELKPVFVHMAPGHEGFRHALEEMGYRTAPVNGNEISPTRRFVEDYICKLLLEAEQLRGIGDRPAPDIVVVSHGQAVFEAMYEVPEEGQRLIAIGFPERMPSSTQFDAIERIDLERDVNAFSTRLPRNTAINVDQFDPTEELSRLF